MSAAQVYRMFDAAGRLLYVGCSQSAGRRFLIDHRRSPWFDATVTVTIEHFATIDAATNAELQAIRTEAPVHNKSPIPYSTKTRLWALSGQEAELIVDRRREFLAGLSR